MFLPTVFLPTMFRPSTGRESGSLGAIGLASIVAVIVTACGSTSGGSASGDAVDEWAKRPYFDQSVSSPLSKFMGYDGDPKTMEAKFKEQNKKAQELVATCMTTQGFEYIPFTGGFSDFNPFDQFGDMTKAEYAKKWGYAISTMINPDGSSVEGSPNSAAPSEEVTDPNQKIREAMSESEGAAYDKALYGFSPDEGPLATGTSDDSGDPETPPPAFEPSGCQAQGFQNGLDQKGEESMQKAYEDLSKRVEADPRNKAAKRAYRSCMKTAGYPEVKTPDEPYNVVQEKMSKLWEQSAEDTNGGAGSDNSDGSSSGVTTVDGESSGGVTVEDGSTIVVGDPGGASFGPKVDAKELKKVQKYELALAVAELPCRATFELATFEIQNEYEEKFIKENKALLDKAKSAGGLG